MVHNEAIIYNVIAGIRYHFLADDGPKYREVCVKTPIMTRYVGCNLSEVAPCLGGGGGRRL